MRAATIRVWIESVGLAVPGLPSWREARATLRGEAELCADDADRGWQSTLLPPNERRRATASVRQAFRAGEDAKATSALDFSRLASVFASSDADMTVLNRMCTALAAPPHALSPTDFHNSVHNAASGYWSIAVRSMAPTTTVAGYDDSFGIGLLEAIGLVPDAEAGVLLIAYDVPAPPPLAAHRSLALPASVALTMTHSRTQRALASLSVTCVTSDTPLSACRSAPLEALRGGNPALRALPLLEALALHTSASLVISAGVGVRVALDVQPVTA